MPSLARASQPPPDEEDEGQDIQEEETLSLIGKFCCSSLDRVEPDASAAGCQQPTRLDIHSMAHESVDSKCAFESPEAQGCTGVEVETAPSTLLNAICLRGRAFSSSAMLWAREGGEVSQRWKGMSAPT